VEAKSKKRNKKTMRDRRNERIGQFPLFVPQRAFILGELLTSVEIEHEKA
jgi:hypothetical protein